MTITKTWGCLAEFGVAVVAEGALVVAGGLVEVVVVDVDESGGVVTAVVDEEVADEDGCVPVAAACPAELPQLESKRAKAIAVRWGRDFFMASPWADHSVIQGPHNHIALP